MNNTCIKPVLQLLIICRICHYIGNNANRCNPIMTRKEVQACFCDHSEDSKKKQAGPLKKIIMLKSASLYVVEEKSRTIENQPGKSWLKKMGHKRQYAEMDENETIGVESCRKSKARKGKNRVVQTSKISVISRHSLV